MVHGSRQDPAAHPVGRRNLKRAHALLRQGGQGSFVAMLPKAWPAPTALLVKAGGLRVQTLREWKFFNVEQDVLSQIVLKQIGRDAAECDRGSLNGNGDFVIWPAQGEAERALFAIHGVARQEIVVKAGQYFGHVNLFSIQCLPPLFNGR